MDLKIVRDKMIGSDEQRAVSPVIGVILMVAITVILAAVIAAFVLDLGDTSANPQAGFDVSPDSEDSDESVVTLNNVDRLDSWEAYCGDAPDSGDELVGDASVGETQDPDCPTDEVSIVGEYQGDRAVLR